MTQSIDTVRQQRSDGDSTVSDASRYLMNTFRRLPIVLAEGDAVYVRDSDGREYLDFVAGIAVNALGHNHPAIQRAIREQAGRLVHCSNLYYSQPQVALAKRLVEITFPSRAFLCNSGAEANECAIKIARKWGRTHRGGAHEILSVERSFHGRTLATLAATGQEKFGRPFVPLPAGFRHVPFGDFSALERATTDATVAIMLESMIGEGGMFEHPPGYLEQARQWCDANDLLLIVDEVQTGIGRTGHWFSYQQSPITPDILTMAKALGAGIPIGACLAAARADVLEPGDHGTTFGGNPLASAVACELLDVIDRDGLVAQAGKLGVLLTELLAKLPHVLAVRGRGLMQGCEFAVPIARQVELEALNQGLIVNAVNEHTLRIVPPLIITADELALGGERLEKAITAVAPL